MATEVGSLVGGGWLSEEYGVQPVQPLRYLSRIGGTKTLREANGFHNNTFPKSYEPNGTLAGHLEFMFKHERIHLEFLSRLFERVGGKEIADWAVREPKGQYSRRTAWLYEWLTGRRLDAPDVTNAPYVDALEPERYWTAKQGVNIQRWRVRDNMPGTKEYCPMVLLSDAVRSAVARTDVRGSLLGLEEEFGKDLLLRSAVWLTVMESRSSFEIEGEHEPKRIERFAIAMERFLGQVPDLFGEDLEPLQKEILGERAVHYGLRQAPIFVGQTTRFQQIAHYVGPHFEVVPAMLQGLRHCAERTFGFQPLVRAAVLSFAYVYLHPLSDGNGRVSRFIVNDVIRSEGIVPPPYVLPVSVLIMKDRTAYDRILDVFSQPFRQRYSKSWRFTKDITYPDGQVSNLEFDEYTDANHAWKYLDLSDHVLYVADVVAATLSQEMHQEASYLRKNLRARNRLNEVIEAGDNALDRIIRSIVKNCQITGAIKAEFPLLEDHDLGTQAIRAVLDAFAEN